MIKRVSTYFLLIFLFCLIASIGWATDYYVDPECGTGGAHYACGDGTAYITPENLYSDLSLSNGDDVRFLCGSTTTETITITINGVDSNNYAILGAYNADGSHEDGGNETFGANCSGGSAKPKFSGTHGVGTLVKTPIGGNTYLKLNSLALYGGFYGIRLRSNYNIAEYNDIYDTTYGIAFGYATGAEDTDYNTVQYNKINCNDAVDGSGYSGDGIYLGIRAQNNTVQNNTITGQDHGGINQINADYNTIQYNYGYETNGHEGFCIGGNGFTYAIIRWNFCKNHGQALELYGDSYNEVYGNIFTCDTSGPTPYQYQPMLHLLANSPSTTFNTIDNKIYNNTLYKNDDVSDLEGITLHISASALGQITGNEFKNNLILDVSRSCFRSVENDAEGDLTNTTLQNNLCYDYGSQYMTLVDGSTTNYASAADLNAESHGDISASGNRDDDPDLANHLTYQLWPDETADPPVLYGQDLGGTGDCSSTFDENCLIDPDNTNFGDGTTAPVVALEAQESQVGTHIIGAYGLSGGSVTYPLQGAKIEGVKIN